MGEAMTVLLALLRRVPIWIWAVVVLLGIVGGQQRVIHRQQVYVRQARASTKEAVDALGTANAAIVKLQTANRQCVDENAANLARAKTYFDAARDYAAQLQAQKDKAEHTIQVIYEHDPSARQWGATRVPPAIADQLRAGARRPHADR